jgi:hypothetical protein
LGDSKTQSGKEKGVKMNTICVMKEFHGKKSYRWIPDNRDVYIGETEGVLRQARYAKIGDRITDNNGVRILGICVEHIKNDPDADLFAMDSVEMIEEIRKLRTIIRNK